MVKNTLIQRFYFKKFKWLNVYMLENFIKFLQISNLLLLWALLSQFFWQIRWALLSPLIYCNHLLSLFNRLVFDSKSLLFPFHLLVPHLSALSLAINIAFIDLTTLLLEYLDPSDLFDIPPVGYHMALIFYLIIRIMQLCYLKHQRPALFLFSSP